MRNRTDEEFCKLHLQVAKARLKVGQLQDHGRLKLFLLFHELRHKCGRRISVRHTERFLRISASELILQQPRVD